MISCDCLTFRATARGVKIYYSTDRIIKKNITAWRMLISTFPFYLIWDYFDIVVENPTSSSLDCSLVFFKFYSCKIYLKSKFNIVPSWSPNTFTEFCQGFSHSTRMWDVVGWWMFPNNTILWCFTIGLRPATFLQQVYKPKCIESPLLVKIS